MAEQKIIDVEPRHLKMVNSIFARNLPFKKVWAFGSRVKWTARPASDLDCVVFGATDGEISKAKEAFDESEVPFEVQLLNWENIPDDFKENIKKEYFVVREESDWGEFKLGDLLESNSNQPKVKKIKRSDYKEEGFYPIIDQSQSDIAGYANDESSLYQGKLPAIVFGDHTRVLKFIDFPFCIGADGTQILLPNSNQNVRYFYYALKNLDLKNYGYERHFKYLKQEKILTPPLPTQQKIASILSAYDDTIENNNRRIKILEEMAQEIYKEWFVNFKFPNHQNTKFVDSELGKIPEGWEVVELGKKIEIRKGKNITKDTVKEGNIPVVAGGLSPAYYHSEFNTEDPVITISASGANAGYVNLYHDKIWASDCSFIDKKSTQFVCFYYLFLKNKQIEITGLQRGSAQPHVYPKDLMALKIFNIPNNLISDFEEKILPIFLSLKNLSFKNQNLRQTRDLLLPRLISGELSVENLEVKI